MNRLPAALAAGVALTLTACSSPQSPGPHHSGHSSPAAQQAAPTPAALPSSATTAAAVNSCGNHLRMALVMADVTKQPGAERRAFVTSARPRPPSWEADAFAASYRTFRVMAHKVGPAAALRDARFGVHSLTTLCLRHMS